MRMAKQKTKKVKSSRIEDKVQKKIPKKSVGLFKAERQLLEQ